VIRTLLYIAIAVYLGASNYPLELKVDPLETINFNLIVPDDGEGEPIVGGNVCNLTRKNRDDYSYDCEVSSPAGYAFLWITYPISTLFNNTICLPGVFNWKDSNGKFTAQNRFGQGYYEITVSATRTGTVLLYRPIVSYINTIPQICFFDCGGFDKPKCCCVEIQMYMSNVTSVGDGPKSVKDIVTTTIILLCFVIDFVVKAVTAYVDWNGRDEKKANFLESESLVSNSQSVDYGALLNEQMVPNH